ncbi:hypothetical protein SAMN05518855_103226 [Paenibacillus sp. CF384]|nr:hypothetical protein SAMN05518855_103226 [Paenibacillus sp. CF384]
MARIRGLWGSFFVRVAAGSGAATLASVQVRRSSNEPQRSYFTQMMGAEILTNRTGLI